MTFYVCDHCGELWSFVSPEDGDGLPCPSCDSERVWEFDREQPAREHSAHISRGHASGLFRRARA